MMVTDKILCAKPCRCGVTLVEILVALLVLVMAVLPAVGAFSSFYGAATRQLEQETALKIGEAVVSLLLSVHYQQLITGSPPLTLDLNIQTPSGDLRGELAFSGMRADSTPVTIGRADYSVSAEVIKVFTAQNLTEPHQNALEFVYADLSAIPTIPQLPELIDITNKIATYSSFDDLVCIRVKVEYGQGRPISLTTFRADMQR